MIQKILALALMFSTASAIPVSSASAADANEWRVFSKEANGDVHFYDASRVQTTPTTRMVWQRIQYKTSVMAAASYQSLMKIDCSERTERTLQRTFFSDRHWEKPAMNTDMKPKRKRSIKKGSATERLSEILCDK